MTQSANSGRQLRVAIVGSGPSGFYAAQHLLKRQDPAESPAVSIDMFERLPVPYGLVRYGVAPDHQKIKSVVKAYAKIAQSDGFRFFGGVEFRPGDYLYGDRDGVIVCPEKLD